MIAQYAGEQVDARQVRDVFQRQPVFGQKACDQQRQGRVLGARNRNGALKRFTADDPDPIHKFERLRIKAGHRED